MDATKVGRLFDGFGRDDGGEKDRDGYVQWDRTERLADLLGSDISTCRRQGWQRRRSSVTKGVVWMENYRVKCQFHRLPRHSLAQGDEHIPWRTTSR
jgi:hypothetical protein